MNDFSPLAEILAGVDRPGAFCVSGSVETTLPDVLIEGVGPLSFPLPASQAQQLIQISERAPYGRGDATLVDTDVRRTWQIAPERVHLKDKRWTATLKQIVERVAAGLGCAGEDIHAELYKALLYDQGSFFVEHRDTEKTTGMFATLVVILPSRFRGGELVVKHNDQEVCLALQGEDIAQVSYGAFYADCLHELRPVTDGYRLCLVYNLVRRPGARLLRAPDYREQTRQAAAFLKTWNLALANRKAPAPPAKLLYVLEHSYTPENLSFAGLKNGDAAVAAVLGGAAREAGCDFWLAMVSIEESGVAEESFDRGYRRRRYRDEDDDDEDDADFKVIEVSDRSQYVENWIAPDDTRMGLRKLPFVEAELFPPESLEDEAPDEQHYMEATGNEGATFERTYRRAALVLWPAERRMDVLAAANLFDVLPYFTQRVEAWNRGAARDGQDRDEIGALAGRLIERWPKDPTDGAHYSNDEQGAQMLASLCRLQDTGLTRRFLSDVVAANRYNGSENEALVGACKLLGWEAFGSLLVRLIERHRLWWFTRCAELLTLLPDEVDRAAQQARREAAEALLAGLPGAPKAHYGGWSGPPAPDARLLAATLRALWSVGDAKLVASAVDHVLSLGDVYQPDALLLPALTGLFEQQGTAVVERPGFERLRGRVVEFLQARIAEPLEAPRDWTREARVSCRCADCKEMAAFLADKATSTWRLRANQDRRSHVEGQIRANHCDLHFSTERRGSPHTLVCVKNQSSYERRCQQRKEDLAGLARVSGMRERMAAGAPHPRTDA